MSTEAAISNSPDYSEASADFFLVSKDNVRFGVRKGDVAANSSVFRDMYECGSKTEQSETLRMEETAEILHTLLGFMSCQASDFRISTIQRTDSGMGYLYRVVAAVDKYSVFRGMDIIAKALLLSVLQNDMSPILNQLVFGYAFAVRVGDAPVEEVILNKIKQAAPSIENLEGAVKIAVDSGFHDTFKLVDYFLRAYNKIATLRRNLSVELHEDGFAGSGDKWDDTESLDDAKCRIRALDRWNESAAHLSVHALTKFMNEEDYSDCTCGECESTSERSLQEYLDGLTDIWEVEI